VHYSNFTELIDHIIVNELKKDDVLAERPTRVDIDVDRLLQGFHNDREFDKESLQRIRHE